LGEDLKKRLRETLARALPPEELSYVHNSYDIIGDIAVLRLGSPSRKLGQIISEAIMGVHKNVKTVLRQTSPVKGDLRLRELEYVLGEKKTATVHKEHGCVFYVDLRECYYSPRLLYERTRIAEQVGEGETVINMFAGVGSFSIIIARDASVEKVYSIDVNPAAIRYMLKNVRVNGVYGKVVPILGDAKEIVEKRLSHTADRVLMPLPEKALEYLPYALLAIRGSEGWIHYHAFEHATKAENPMEKVKQKVAQELERLGASCRIPFGRVVRTTGPNWSQVVLDIAVRPSIGKFNKTPV
jgi:tRNA (guanine37-N1)-methyltransferase